MPDCSSASSATMDDLIWTDFKMVVPARSSPSCRHPSSIRVRHRRSGRRREQQVLDVLGQTRTGFLFGQGPKNSGFKLTPAGVWKVPTILASGEVDPGLATCCGVHHAQEGGGDEPEIHSPQAGARHEAREIGDGATAQRHNRTLAVKSDRIGDSTGVACSRDFTASPVSDKHKKSVCGGSSG